MCDKLSRSRAETKHAVKDKSNLERSRDEHLSLQRKLEKHLDIEQARTKRLYEEVAKMKALVHKRDGEITDLQTQVQYAQREKEEAQNVMHTLMGESKELARTIKELNDVQNKLSKESERATELSFALDRASDIGKKFTREASDWKRKIDAEAFAKEQSLRREETVKRSLSEAHEYAAEFKQQAEAEILQLRKEVVGICRSAQKTHSKVCGQVVGSAAGVGLFLIDPSSADCVVVDSVVPGRSAALDGRVTPGDQILEVDGENVRTRRADYINSLLAGETGSSVIVKVQKPSGVGGVYVATFVRSSAKSRCMNSEDVSELCRDVEMVQETLKGEVTKLQDKIAGLERRHAQDREQAVQEHAQLSSQLYDSQSKLSRAMQRITDAAKARGFLEEELRVSNEVADRARTELDAMKLNATTVEQVKRNMEKKLRFHEKQLRHWAAQQAAVLRDNCSNVTLTFQEIEGGVLDTARTNLRYANELDGLQVVMSRLEPELETATKNLTEKEAELTGALDRIRQLKHECRLQTINRGDILAQLQDALLREAELRENVTHVDQERNEYKERLGNTETQNLQLDFKLKRMQDQMQLLESKVADSRDVDHARQQELVSLERKLADTIQRFSSQVSKLSKDLDIAYNATRQMHMSICSPVVGLTSGIGILISSDHKSGGCRIASVEGSRSNTNSNSALHAGDLILEIDGQDVRQVLHALCMHKQIIYAHAHSHTHTHTCICACIQKTSLS